MTEDESSQDSLYCRKPVQRHYGKMFPVATSKNPVIERYVALYVRVLDRERREIKLQ
jgi:hypothetical protein